MPTGTRQKYEWTRGGFAYLTCRTILYFPEDTRVSFFLKYVVMLAGHGICYPMIDRDRSSRGIFLKRKGKEKNKNKNWLLVWCLAIVPQPQYWGQREWSNLCCPKNLMFCLLGKLLLSSRHCCHMEICKCIILLSSNLSREDEIQICKWNLLILKWLLL